MTQKKFFLIIIIMFIVRADARKSAITCTRGGRLGDKLISYCKAKWLAYKYDLDFFCPPFQFSDSLMLYELEQPYHKGIHKKFKKLVTLSDESQIDANSTDILYFSPFHIKPQGFENPIDILETCHENPEFFQQFKKMITPRVPIRSIDIPQGMPSIAVHVRRGGGFDLPLLHGTKPKPGVEYADVRWPKRFPPDEYYIQQLKDMMKLFDPKQEVYVHLFTDDPHPERMVEKYTQAIGRRGVHFGYRIDNDYTATVLEDLMGMTQFDYIIRSTSLFSFIALLLGHHRCMVWPKYAEWNDNLLTVIRVWRVDRLADNQIVKESVTVEYT